LERSHDLKFNNNQNEKCLNKVLSYFSEKDTNLIVVIIGPSGSGKTLLAKRALIDGLFISPDEPIAGENLFRVYQIKISSLMMLSFLICGMC
jgi:predicted AAA+ superfamily ATPase